MIQSLGFRAKWQSAISPKLTGSRHYFLPPVASMPLSVSALAQLKIGVKAASPGSIRLWRSFGWTLGFVIAARLVIPVSPAGYWRGSYFDCLCSAETVGEFRDGAAKHHLLPWADSVANSDKVETHPAGTYERSGWCSFAWNQSDARGSHKFALKPGWLFCRIVDLRSGQVWWAIREFNFARLFRIHHQRDARPKTAATPPSIP